MSFFEYKVVPAPITGRWRQKRVEGLDRYASTVADMMTELGLEGWDFIGAEILRERRRRFLILVCDVERTLLIFRRIAQPRDLDSAGSTSTSQSTPVAEVLQAAPVTPRRVSRPELVEAVAAGARRVHVPTRNPVAPDDQSSGIARAVQAAKAASAGDTAAAPKRPGASEGDRSTGVAAE
jgi:hypothetical protein